MLNLHPPFRWASAADTEAISALAGTPRAEVVAGTVVAEENGRLAAVVAGRPNGPIWRVDTLAVVIDQREELGPRLLALTDALAAEEECDTVAIGSDLLGPDLRAIAEEEGFRLSADGHLVRPVVPQG